MDQCVLAWKREARANLFVDEDLSVVMKSRQGPIHLRERFLSVGRAACEIAKVEESDDSLDDPVGNMANDSRNKYLINETNP